MMLVLRCKTTDCTSYVQLFMRDTDDELERKRTERLVRSQLPARCPGCGAEIFARWHFPYRDAGVPT